jgi:hypothetical protein
MAWRVRWTSDHGLRTVAEENELMQSSCGTRMAQSQVDGEGDYMLTQTHSHSNRDATTHSLICIA